MTISKVLTRRELYDLVWSKPMRDLASDFGISDVGLAKICNRHRIPKPGRGYWAKLQAGKKVDKAVFREVDDDRLNRIRIHSATQQLPPAAREVIERARAERPRRKVVPPAQTAPELIRQVQEVHPAVRRTARTLRKAKPDTNDTVQAIGDGLCGVDVAVSNVERAIAILDGLARRLEAKGLPLEPTGQAMRIALGAESATFTVKERTRREKHVPTPEELLAEERREKKRQRYWQSHRAWDYDYSGLFGRAYPEFDTVNTGVLVFQIEGYADGVRRTWADGKTQRVELLLDDITVGLEALLAVRKAQREAREERERQWQEQARRRELARQRAEREEKRVQYLNSVLDVHEEIVRLRQWLSQAQPASCTEPDSDFCRMVDWAEQRLATLETTADAANIDRDLKSKELFPAVDELRDPAGEPPDDRFAW